MAVCVATQMVVYVATQMAVYVLKGHGFSRAVNGPK
jgi:hypothetical protein